MVQGLESLLGWGNIELFSEAFTTLDSWGISVAWPMIDE
jgi:hypothetical protein